MEIAKEDKAKGNSSPIKDDSPPNIICGLTQHFMLLNSLELASSFLGTSPSDCKAIHNMSTPQTVKLGRESPTKGPTGGLSPMREIYPVFWQVEIPTLYGQGKYHLWLG